MFAIITEKIKESKAVFFITILPLLYFWGFLGYKLFLISIGIPVIPTDVYSKIDILLSGIYTFCIGLVCPLVLFALCNFTTKKKREAFGRISYYFVSGVISVYCFYFIGSRLISTALNSVDKDRRIWMIVLFIFFVVLVVAMTFLFDFIRNKFYSEEKNGLRSLTLILVAVLFLWFTVVGVLLHGFNGDYILAGMPPEEISVVQKGSIGFIYTDDKICDSSVLCENGKYETGGFLLSVQNGMYYFSPGIFVSETLPDTRLCIIPEDGVDHFRIHTYD